MQSSKRSEKFRIFCAKDAFVSGHNNSVYSGVVKIVEKYETAN